MSLMEALASSVRRSGGRAEKDHYYKTPPTCTEALLERETFGPFIWEPACGDGAISRVLAGAGYQVRSSDLVDRGYAESRRDFLFEHTPFNGDIITNPPFKMADEFALKALYLGAAKVAIFQRLNWIEGRARYVNLWSKHPPVRIWAFSGRQTLWRGDDNNPKSKGGAIAFAWFVWERGYSGDPAMKWIV